MTTSLHGDDNFTESLQRLLREVRLPPVPLRVPRLYLRCTWRGTAPSARAARYAALVRYGSDGSDRYYRPGQIYMAAQPHHYYDGTIADTEVELAVLDPALPAQLADTAPGRAQHPLRFTGYESVSQQAAQQRRATYAHVRDGIRANPDAAPYPLVRSSAAQLLAADPARETVTAIAYRWGFPSAGMDYPRSLCRKISPPAAPIKALYMITYSSGLVNWSPSACRAAASPTAPRGPQQAEAPGRLPHRDPQDAAPAPRARPGR
ncbi:MAG TPA: hypothetical protein VFV41_19210 [Streptosporangiaceae bacterium]|nr:hypothetical protein [Streptosporangiaceae bacterium]